MLVTTSLDHYIRVWDVRDVNNVKLVDKLKPKAVYIHILIKNNFNTYSKD